MNEQQRQYIEAINGTRGERLMYDYERWSDKHTLHLAARQGMSNCDAIGVLGKGHTPKLGYFAPGSASTHQDLTREDYLGWIMHTGQRLHFLSRIPCDEGGRRCPTGRQQTSWMKMLEADLFLQSVTIPPKIEGLAAGEYDQLKIGLKDIGQSSKTGLNELRGLARKAYTKAGHTIKEQEQDDLTNWIDRILDPEKGYTEAHRWTRGTAKAPPLPTHLVVGEGTDQRTYGPPHELGEKYVRDWGELWTQPPYAPWAEVASLICQITWTREDLEPLTIEDIRLAIFSLRPGRR